MQGQKKKAEKKSTGQKALWTARARKERTKTKYNPVYKLLLNKQSNFYTIFLFIISAWFKIFFKALITFSLYILCVCVCVCVLVCV